MGWDAISSVKIEWDDMIKKMVIITSNEREAFEHAALEVVKEAGSVDCLLEVGSLDVGDCGNMLERATGESVYGGQWSSKRVKILNEEANWDFTTSKKDFWAFLSAKMFLELCAKFSLSIKFTC